MKDKQESQKKIIKLFQENPIAQIACYKAGVSRSTFYRWRQEDDEFRKTCVKALKIGLDIANDAVESVLLKKAREGDMRAIPYWLNTNSKKYKNTKGYNEQHFILLRELNESKREYDELIEDERKSIIELFDEVKRSPRFEEPSNSTGKYLEGLISV
jgi:hypothetical protein